MADQDHRGHHLNEDSGLFIDDISESRVIAMEAAEDAFSQDHSCPKMPDIPETSSSLDITLSKEWLVKTEWVDQHGRNMENIPWPWHVFHGVVNPGCIIEANFWTDV